MGYLYILANLFVVILTVAVVLLIAAAYMLLPAMKKNKTVEKHRKTNFAHRGLHDIKNGIPENSISAFGESIKAGFGFEFDLHLTKDNNIVVMHDTSLKRTAGIDRLVTEMTTDELKKVTLLGSNEQVPFLSEVLELVDGQVPLLIELKTDNNYAELCENCFKLLDKYEGDYLIESFDPRVLMWLKKHRKNVARGQLATGGATKSKVLNFFLGNLFSNVIARPHFIAYDKWNYKKLFSLKVLKSLFGTATYVWTIKDKNEFDEVEKHGSSSIFESFMP